MSPYNPHDSRIGKPGKPFRPELATRRPNIPAHAVTAIVAFALGVAVGAIAVLEGWA